MAPQAIGPNMAAIEDLEGLNRAGRAALAGSAVGTIALACGIASFFTQAPIWKLVTAPLALAAIALCITFIVKFRKALAYHGSTRSMVERGSAEYKLAQKAGVLAYFAASGLTFGIAGLGFAFIL